MATAAITTASLYFLSKQNEIVSNQSVLVAHTHEVLKSLQEVRGNNLRSESNLRAYLLTFDDRFLQERQKAVLSVQDGISQVDVLTQDNSVQGQNLRVLRALMQKRLEYGDQLIAVHARAKKLLPVVPSQVRTSFEMTSKIDTQIKLMTEEEKRLLDQRRAAFERAMTEARNIELILALLSVIGLTGALILTYRYMQAKMQSDERFRAIFDHTYQFIGLLNPDGRVLEVNRTALEFAGITANQARGMSFWETPWWSHSEETKKEARDAVARAAKGQFVRFETVHYGPDGRSITVDFSLKPVLDKTGKVIYLLPEGRDVSEQRAAQRLVEDSENRLRAVFTCLAEGVYQIDLDGNLVYMNKAAERLLGHTQNELLGRNMHEAIHSVTPDGEFRKSEDCPLLRVAQTGIVCRVSEDWFQRIDGTFMPVEYVSSPLQQEGKVVGAVVAFQDISLRRDAENRVSEFYSSVSHELRTPLTSIRGALKLLEAGKGGELGERGKHLVTMGRQECDRLVRLINDILDIRKIEAGKLELKLENVNASAFVEQAVDSLNALAQENNVKLRVDGSCNMDVKVDKDRLTQILTNLISNAIKFSPPQGEVLIRVARDNDSVRFSVMDRGVGISIANQQKLFRLFQQVDSTDSRPKGGTGLGLAISKALVEQHGGRIGVDSQEGEGSTFWFTIPLPGVNFIKQEAAPQAVVERPLVLVVEDDESLATVLLFSLLDRFEIKQARSLHEALAKIEVDKPRVILLDIHLPDGSGVELLDQLRSRPSTEDIPVVLMSGDAPERSYYVHPLVVDYMQKPFAENVLIDTLDRALKYRPARLASAVVAEDDDFTRDLLVQQLTRLGVKVKAAATGEDALNILRGQKTDLLILDLGLPGMDGARVVETLKAEGLGNIPLLVFTARDLNATQKANITLGPTRHLTKSLASEEQLVATIRELLDGLTLTTESGVFDSLDQRMIANRKKVLYENLDKEKEN